MRYYIILADWIMGEYKNELKINTKINIYIKTWKLNTSGLNI